MRRFPAQFAYLTWVTFLSVTCFSAYFAARSLYVASTETSMLPLGDIWWFYRDYFSYVDGTYSFRHLFDRHNEHIVMTLRLALFVDTIWFRGSGKFALAISYISAAAAAFMLGWLAARPVRWQITGWSIAFLGLTWANIQLDNLTLPFQAVFPMAHAFVLLTLISLQRGSAGSSWWYAIAFAADFASVFTIGTGVLTGASAVALAIWLRKIDRIYSVFLAYHVALVALFAWLLNDPGFRANGVLPSPSEAVAYFFAFLGNFTFNPAWGVVIAASSVVLFTYPTWVVARRKLGPSPEFAVLAAFALFIVLEAASATFARAQLGTEQAFALRYSTCTLLLAATLFAAALRLFPTAPGRLAATVTLAATVHIANPQVIEQGFRMRNQVQEALAAEIAKGRMPADVPVTLCMSPNLLPIIQRFREARLGPFQR
ncbi:MAG: hypothetical protein ACRER2_07335 [Methylococcales bacterium]